MKEIEIQKLYEQMEENFQLGLKNYRAKNFHKGIEYFQKALGTCEIIHCDEAKETDLLFYLGHAYQLRNSTDDFQMAEDHYQQLLGREELPQDLYYKIQYSRGLGFMSHGEYEKALDIFNEINVQENPHLSRVWANQSYSYFLMGKYEDVSYFTQSMVYCNRILENADREQERESLFHAYHNLGHIYYEQGENIKAIMNFQESIACCISDLQRYETYVDMGLCLIRLFQYDLAWAYIDGAQKFFEKNKELVYIAGCLFAKGKYYKKKGKTEEATYYFELSLSGYREKEYYYGIVKAYYELYDLYHRIDMDRAELYYDQHKFYMNYISSPGIERLEFMTNESDLLI